MYRRLKYLQETGLILEPDSFVTFSYLIIKTENVPSIVEFYKLCLFLVSQVHAWCTQLHIPMVCGPYVVTLFLIGHVKLGGKVALRFILALVTLSISRGRLRKAGNMSDEVWKLYLADVSPNRFDLDTQIVMKAFNF